ncbi:MAG: sulfatase [Spirochaetaceae bacterium]|nr:MAG: sulfatase [Spirochaetaceae bacterium]
MAASRQPNIIFILSDDQGYWAAGPYGNQEVRTPSLDRIAAGGMTCDRMFCVSPVCSPARASLLTGTIPSAHGIHDWIRRGNSVLEEDRPRPIEYLAGLKSYTSVLSDAGYRCGLVGKWHLGNAHLPQQGFQYWRVHPHGAGPYYDSRLIDEQGSVQNHEGYLSDVITNEALRFLEARPRGDLQPYYLAVHYTAPHSPWGREHHPSELFDRYYEECPFESTPQIQISDQQISSTPVGFTPEERRSILSGYYAAVEQMDVGIGRILDYIRDRGEEGETLILFSSDNGMSMGHHGLYGKGNASFPANMFETAVRVPFLCSWPGFIRAGERTAQLMSHYDVAPTILALAGLENPQNPAMPGINISSALIEGPASTPGNQRHDDYALNRQYLIVFSEYGPVHMVRGQQYKYVHRYPYGPHELYDLDSDPDETCNLVDLGEYQQVRCELRELLGSWFMRYYRSERDGRSLPVTGRGQTGLVGTDPNSVFCDDWFYVTREPDRHRGFEA